VTSNKGVLHFWPFAKYAVAFPRMSRSIFTRANSARKRLISICSELTLLLFAPVSRPSRFALARLYHSNRFLLELERVLRSCRLGHRRLLALLNHSARDTSCAGKVSTRGSPVLEARQKSMPPPQVPHAPIRSRKA